jgi:hypothetical protein
VDSYILIVDVFYDIRVNYLMSKKKNQELTPEQKRELDNIIEVIQTEADIVKMDYEQNPSNLDSGSVIVVHQNSTLLDDTKEKLSDIAYNIKRRKKDE